MYVSDPDLALVVWYHGTAERMPFLQASMFRIDPSS